MGLEKLERFCDKYITVIQLYNKRRDIKKYDIYVYSIRKELNELGKSFLKVKNKDEYFFEVKLKYVKLEKLIQEHLGE